MRDHSLPQGEETKGGSIAPEDIDLIKAMPRGLPHLPFFRHVPGLKGIKAGTPFGPKYLYTWWKRACAA